MSDHACDACDGSGAAYWIAETFWLVEHIRQVRQSCRCQWCRVGYCPICLGAGRISDVMPVADALADAETLRTNIPGVSFRCASVVDASLLGGATVRALNLGYYDERTVERAIKTARAAFRAVPGLRGE